MTGILKTLAPKLQSLATLLGGPGLLLVAMADSSFLSVPEGNDLLIVILSIGQSWSRMCYLVLMTIIGSVIGCSLLYATGRKGGAFVQRMARGRLKGARAVYQKHGAWTIVVAAVLPPPMPFKIFVLAAGFFRVPFSRFFLAALCGRSVRYFTWGVLAVLFGERVKEYIERNLVTVGTVLAAVITLTLAGYFLFRKRFDRVLAGSEEP